MHMRHVSLFAGLVLAAGAFGFLLSDAEANVVWRPGPDVEDDDPGVYRSIGIAFDWTPLSTTNGAVQQTVPDNQYKSIGSPDGSLVPVPVPLNGGTGPPLDFTFYGEEFQEVFIHGNGFLSFTADDDPGDPDFLSQYGTSKTQGEPLDVTEMRFPDTMVAGFWANLTMTTCGSGKIFTTTEGVAPDRVFKIQYTDMVHRRSTEGTGPPPPPGGPPTNGTCPQPPTDHHTFQIHLREGSDQIEMHYLQASHRLTSPANQDVPVTVGIMHRTARNKTGDQTGYGIQSGFFDGTANPPDEPDPDSQTHLTRVATRYYPNTAPQWIDTVRFDVVEDTPAVFELPIFDAEGDRIDDWAIDTSQTALGTLTCADGTCTYVPDADAFGPDTFRYRAKDAWGFWGQDVTVEINVLPVNDPPTFTPSGDVSVAEDDKIFRIDWASGITVGPQNEALDGQGFEGFIIEHDNPDMFLIQPAIVPQTGELYFKVKYGGTSDLEIRLKDDGGTALGGVDTTEVYRMRLFVKPNFPPNVRYHDPPTIDEGDFALLSPVRCAIDDDASQPEQIQIELAAAPTLGALWRDGVPLSVGGSFTAADIVSELIVFQSHATGAGTEHLSLRARDHQGASALLTCDVHVQPGSDPVAQRVRPLRLMAGATGVITSDLLSHDDGAGSLPVDLTYTVLSPPGRGVLQHDGEPTTSFSQRDIDEGRVRYVHDTSLDVGADRFFFTVRDLEAFETSPRPFPIEVVPYDDAPVLAPLPDIEATPGEGIVFVAVATDADGDDVRFRLRGAPSGATLDPESGTFRWRPLAVQTGTFQIRIEVYQLSAPSLMDALDVKITVRSAVATPFDNGDADQDGIADWRDNCAAVANHDQRDSDRDGVGDACDFTDDRDPSLGPLQYRGNMDPDDAFPDGDGDGIVDFEDNCPGKANHYQEDGDADNVGDVCDDDLDGDGVPEWSQVAGFAVDNCPTVHNPDQADSDGDGRGDACAAASASDDAGAEAGGTDAEDVVPLDNTDTRRLDVPTWGWILVAVAAVLVVGSVSTVIAMRRQ